MAESNPAPCAYIFLDNPTAVAIAVFPHEGSFIIVLGNISEADAPAAADWLHDQAEGYFSSVSQSGRRPGRIDGRSDVFVLVDGPEERVQRFARERLRCQLNQIQ